MFNESMRDLKHRGSRDCYSCSVLGARRLAYSQPRVQLFDYHLATSEFYDQLDGNV
jgi:hypothetical protein